MAAKKLRLACDLGGPFLMLFELPQSPYGVNQGFRRVEFSEAAEIPWMISQTKMLGYRPP